MKPRILLFLFLATAVNSFSQKRNNVWCFGDSALIDFSDTANIITGTSAIRSRGTCVSIADNNDSLIFSANTRATIGGNTTLVWNKFNLLMQNGTNIVGEGWYHELITVPDPSNDSLIYLISIGNTGSSQFGIYFSLINYKDNNDSGLVVQKNIQLQNFPIFDGLQAVKHGNGRDWWIIFQQWDINNNPHNDFFSYLIAPSGLSSMIVQNVGSAHKYNAGGACFNKEGNKFVHVNLEGLIEMYDFDRCTGIISNPITIEPAPLGPPYSYYWSAAFSPDGTKLYVTSYNQPPDTASKFLYQFDLNAPNIGASKQVIHTFLPPIGLGHLKIAPDNKIYLSSMYECPTVYCYPYPDSVYNYINMNLSVINYPDSLGASCNFQPFSFYLGGHRTYYGLPNNPDYELGAVTGSVCDSLTTNLLPAPPKAEEGIAIAPNPFTSEISITLQKQNIKQATISIKNILGQTVPLKEGEMKTPGKENKVDLSFLERGIYLVEVVADGGPDSYREVRKVVKE